MDDVTRPRRVGGEFWRSCTALSVWRSGQTWTDNAAETRNRTLVRHVQAAKVTGVAAGRPGETGRPEDLWQTITCKTKSLIDCPRLAKVTVTA